MFTCERWGRSAQGISERCRAWHFCTFFKIYIKREQGRVVMCSLWARSLSWAGSMCERWRFTDACYRVLQPPKPLPYSCRLHEDLGSVTNSTSKPSKVTQYTEAITGQSVLFILIKNTEQEHFPKCHRRVAPDLGSSPCRNTKPCQQGATAESSPVQDT